MKQIEMPPDALARVSELTGAKVRIFLAEVAEGVTNYRSLHNLTQQVEHQYHGRFLIELIQNAHDAFGAVPTSEKRNRIEVVLDRGDAEHGALLVANDGAPFSTSNFERLSQLGQSDKDPQKSIGNKGIGFRSVLEIAERPEVYSRSSESSAGFDGYCFAFRPEVVQSLVDPMVELARQESVPLWEITGCPLVDWSADMLAKFRRRIDAKGNEWLVGETKYLSPYLLPVPLRSIDSAAAKALEERGFSTVIRLPLKAKELQSYVLEQMEQLSASTVLFLDKVSSLCIRDASGASRIFTRMSSVSSVALDGRLVSIAESDREPSNYVVWTRDLHVDSASEEFRAAVRALPGRWPEISDVFVSVAVRVGDDPEPGLFSIYLPTGVATGSAAHINAPFFGDMSRTHIPFDDAYNRHLLKLAGELALEVIRTKLAGRGAEEGRAIVDLLAPLGGDDLAIQRWSKLLDSAAMEAKASIDEEPLVLAEAGWRPLNATSLVPALPKARSLSEEVLRRHATFDIFHPALDSRQKQLVDLANKRYPGTGAYPTTEDIAATVASVAAELQSVGGDWNAFWQDVIRLLPQGQKALAEHEVLLGADGRLHCASTGSRVFFVPRQGTPDDGDVDSGGGATEIPSRLQAHVAFLSDQIQVYEPSRPAAQTAVRTYLGAGLVSQFRVDTIFSEVLLELTPKMPVPVGGSNSDLCRDIMSWAIRLVGNVVARGRGSEATFRQLRRIPAPCQGGWYPMEEASFGEGWPGTAGQTLSAFLSALTPELAGRAQKRLLLPPSDVAWGDGRIADSSLLQKGGVTDGLRLEPIKQEDWNSRLTASTNDIQLPTNPPPSFTKEQWATYTAFIESECRSPYVTPQTYACGTIWTFPGFSEISALPEAAREGLCSLILRSLPHWGPGIDPLYMLKQGGQSHSFPVTSPLRHFLQFASWLAISDDKATSWWRPMDRWYVPAAALSGRARHFAHLKALPVEVARRLDLDPKLVATLQSLGMPGFDPHAVTASPRLLVALAEATESDEALDANVLLGQLRDAWTRFRPESAQPPLPQLVVRGKDRRLRAVTPTEDSPIYLPDYGVFVSELEQFDLPVLAIYPSDAKDLRNWFIAAYGSRVILTSNLELVPEVSGEKWTGLSATPFADSELGWLTRPLLSLVAFHGQVRGVHSDAFQQRVEVLRNARVDWAPSVSVALTGAGAPPMSIAVNALWNAPRKTLLVAESCRAEPEQLGRALAQALDREDLDLPLRYVLRTLSAVDSEPGDVTAFLVPLGISPEQVKQVIEYLRGDIGHMARLIYVLAEVLVNDPENARILAAKSEEDLLTALSAIDIVGADAQRTLQIARDSQDVFDFGRATSAGWGDAAALVRWNETLARLQQPPLSNRDWLVQFGAALDEASSPFKRVLAHLIATSVHSSFPAMLAAYNDLGRSVDLSRSYWEVDFRAAMGEVARLLESWGAASTLVAAFRAVESREVLRRRLSALGVNLDVDPEECARENRELVERIALELDRLRLAYWLKNRSDGNGEQWKSGIEKYRAGASSHLQGLGFTRIWNVADVLGMMGEAIVELGPTTFAVAASSAKELACLQSELGLEASDLRTADGRLDALKAEVARKRNLIKVCDEDFDSSEGNLDRLWEFLLARMPAEALAKSARLDLGKMAVLVKPKQRTRGDPPTPPAPKKRPRRQSKTVEELVGLAGEIFVYRMLQQQYGTDIVTPSTWISENSRRVFHFNQADDTKGYDFSISLKGRVLRVEVKSSAGDDEAFELGSSEIRCAMHIANKGRRRRESFVLVHVTNALSAMPQAVVLPNPYDPRYRDKFKIEDAGARVRYRT